MEVQLAQDCPSMAQAHAPNANHDVPCELCECGEIDILKLTRVLGKL